MPTKKKSEYIPHIPPEAAPSCHSPNCRAQGLYKAPKSREALHDYRWFCLDHIREHNQKWDYFSGMGSDEIEHFVRDAVTGHRPTWNREQGAQQHYRQLQDALYEFLNDNHVRKPAPPTLSTKLRKALALMDLSYPYTIDELKAQYRSLVKKHHPDVNKGNKRSEELFKQITAAYGLLTEHIATADA